MEKQPYYLAYEKRYKTAYDAGAERWGHSPDDRELYAALRQWVEDNDLKGRRVIEFACGEGAGGVILSELGCIYRGVDISPSAVAKAREALKNYPDARADILDMVRETVGGDRYDAALDSMGFHMLVTDKDRQRYLKNAVLSLKSGAPMLFYKESYRGGEGCANRDAMVSSPVNSYKDWLRITGIDYDTPEPRRIDMGRGDAEVMLPLVPSRANDREGYISEMEAAGFTVEKFVEMRASDSILCSASIYVRKP